MGEDRASFKRKTQNVPGAEDAQVCERTEFLGKGRETGKRGGAALWRHRAPAKVIDPLPQAAGSTTPSEHDKKVATGWGHAEEKRGEPTWGDKAMAFCQEEGPWAEAGGGEQ